MNPLPKSSTLTGVSRPYPLKFNTNFRPRETRDEYAFVFVETTDGYPMKICRSASFKIASALALLASILLGAGCNKDEESTTAEKTTSPSLSFDGERAFEEVEKLIAYSPRDAGTRGARLAAQHILGRLQEFGVAAEIDTFDDDTPEGVKTFHNVVGKIPGKNGKWIILGSHFDTMPGIDNFQGANDSGSSTGILLELARTLSETTPETGIMFAFFDGEEGIAGYIEGDGLHGSRHMADQLDQNGELRQITAMILLDMVGDQNLHFTIPYNSSQWLARTFIDAAKKTGHRDRVSLSLNRIITDDHVPFLNKGISSIDIIDFEFGSKPGLNDYWHTEKDNLEHISAESLKITGTIVSEMARNLVFNP